MKRVGFHMSSMATLPSVLAGRLSTGTTHSALRQVMREAHALLHAAPTVLPGRLSNVITWIATGSRVIARVITWTAHDHFETGYQQGHWSLACPLCCIVLCVAVHATHGPCGQHARFRWLQPLIVGSGIVIPTSATCSPRALCLPLGLLVALVTSRPAPPADLENSSKVTT